MSLFARTRDGKTEERFSLKQLGLAYGSLDWRPGVSVDRSRALRNAAAWACLDVKASSVAETPIDVVRYSGRRRIPVTPTPSLIDAPSALVTQDVWLYQAAWSGFTDGNVFCFITATDSAGRPTTMETIDPSEVTYRDVVNGRGVVMVSGSRYELYPFGPVWHVPLGPTPPGSPYALSPLEHASMAIGTTLAAEDFGGRFFVDGGHPAAIIRATRELTGEQAAAIKASFVNATRGNREPAVLGAGLDYESISVDPKDSQFIDLMRFEVEQICRFFRVPPSMVYGAISGQNVTYSNATQADLHYLKHSLSGPLTRLERALTALLPRPQAVKFNRDAILRSDPLTRAQVQEIRLRNKTVTVNEVRAIEDELPFPDPEFDLPGVPQSSVQPPPAGSTPA